MVHVKALMIGLIGVSFCMANISGTVTDTGTTPIAGVVVQLEKGGQKDTTKANGSFTIATSTSNLSITDNRLSNGMSVRISGNVMTVTLSKNSMVELTAFDLAGKVSFSVRKTLDAGTQNIALPQQNMGINLYKVKTEDREFVLQGNSVGGVSYDNFTIAQGSSFNHMAKQAKATAVINDVITAKKDSLLNYRCVIRNSDTSGIIIKMIKNAGNVTDAEGNVYQSVRIGNQVWTVQNWRCTKYADNTALPAQVTGNSAWAALNTPGYCYYNNTTNVDTIKKWGALYNWYVVSPGNSKKIAPTGWRVPTTADWTQLQTYLTNNRFNYDGTMSGNKMAKALSERTDWASDGGAGVPGNDLTRNNTTGFTALPGGARDLNGTFFEKRQGGCFWSISASGGVDDRHLDYNSVDLHIDGMAEGVGVSIRLLKE